MVVEVDCWRLSIVEMKKNHKERLPKDQPVYIHELTRGSQLVVKRLPQRKKDPAIQEKLRQVIWVIRALLFFSVDCWL